MLTDASLRRSALSTVLAVLAIVWLAVSVAPGVAAAASGDAPAQASTSLLLSGARVLSPEGDRWLDNVDVYVVGERIARIAPPGSIEVADATRGIDLSGLHLVPGLIDLHTHLLLHPYDETAWNDQVLKEALELRTLRAGVAARTTLEAGFTTVRELGTEGAGFADVALRTAIDEGILAGPRVLTATRAIVAVASYGPGGFDPRWRLPKGAQEANGVAGVRLAVREQVAAGADWIKVYADYRRRSGGPSTATFSQEEIDALVHEAHTAGLPVAAHASTDEGIRRAAHAGVQTIEHGSEASTEVLELMRDHNVVLCPTLAAAQSMARYAGWHPGEPEPDRIREAREMFQRALTVGVTIANGSDAGVFSHGDNALEIELMAAWGMQPAAALQAATVTAARVLGRDADLGSIQVGHLADVIAVTGNPLQDVSALRGPRLVVKNGVVVKERN